MKNLIEKIAARTGMDKHTATEALITVSEHVKTEFPLLQSVVDLILGTSGYIDTENMAKPLGFTATPINYN